MIWMLNYILHTAGLLLRRSQQLQRLIIQQLQAMAAELKPHTYTVHGTQRETDSRCAECWRLLS